MFDKSSFENALPPDNDANSSSILCKGYTSLFATLLIVSLWSPQSLTMPSHLITGTTSAAHDENHWHYDTFCLKVVKFARNLVMECKWKGVGI